MIGHYVIPETHKTRPGDFCDQLEEVGDKLVSRKVVCTPIPPWPEGGVAGKRRWMADALELPYISDGGCLMVSLYWDSQARTVTARCNGYG